MAMANMNADRSLWSPHPVSPASMGFKGLTTVAQVASERTIDGKATREERLLGPYAANMIAPAMPKSA
jgi:hypothetical protein